MKRYLRRVDELSSDLPAHDRVDDDSAQVALAAALLHDVGHGPYSHTFEGLGRDQASHEEWTSRIIQDPDTEVHAVLADFDPQLPRAVERLIHGQSSIPHISRAVSGTFDVDRCDYLRRDSHMTGVRYGLLDLDWLLQSLRLHVPSGAQSASLAVDGEKGLTAVEGFFLARLYMYRQVYLHKTVRAAETGIRSLFRRIAEIGHTDGVPLPWAHLLRGEAIDTADYLALDDHVLHHMLEALERASDGTLRRLAGAIRHRRLFKSLALPRTIPMEVARERLDAVLRRAGIEPAYLGTVDRVQVEIYEEDEALMVLRGPRMDRLLDASSLMSDLARSPLVHYRLIFPPEVRDSVTAAFADLS